jgi:PAS domain S-box-containing protein
MLAVPLRKDNAHLGHFVIYRREVRPFSDKQIELVQNFASQAVIAMENARLITEQREALEQQTATAEVLRVINASPGNLVPVFDTILEKALRLCGAAFGSLVTFDGELFHFGVTRGMSSALVEALRQRGPVRPNASIAYDQIARGADIVHIADITDPQRPPPPSSPNIHQDGARTTLFVALRGDDVLLGAFVIYRKEVRPFSDKQIALLKNFADQAVIAMENARLLNEQREALEQQTATAEVLRVINTNPGNLAPVFATILEKAHATCGAQMGSLQIWDGTHVRALATQGYPADVDAMLRRPFLPGTHHLGMIAGDRLSHRIDAALGPNPDNIGEGFRDRSGIRTNLHVPLRRDGIVIGFITANRREVRPFSDREISLLENFAAHAVIAMENARLINETREALEQQTATAEVLQVINASPGNLEPVFDVILEKAHNLCGATRGSFITFNGERFQLTATRGLSDAYKRILRNFNNSSLRAGYATEELSPREQLLNGADSVQLIGPAVTVGPIGRAATELERIGTVLFVPLRRDGKLLGYITAYREEEASFTDKQIAVLQNFAAQAVIAMENARLLNEVRQRQEELRITFEHMGDGVAMFDESQHLVASNGKFQEIFDLPPALLGQHSTYEELLRFLAARGDFGESVETAQQISDLVATTGQPYGYERTRPDGRVIEIRRNPVPGGGFVLIFSDITERKRSEQQIRAARDAAEAAYRDLKAAQASLIQAEKMASLGQLTAGIAHEIKNPLNFVNNFADLSADLLNELHEALAARRQAEIDDLTATLKGNLAKIAEHGRRADSIVKNMLLHSRSGPSEHRLTDLNAVVEEALNLAYHGARAETPGFNMTMQKQLDPAAGMVEIFPQEFTRVLLNLISNGFYAARQRSASADGTFEPTLLVATRDLGDQVQIQVRDNGTGMNEEVQTRIFEPFFTTKPAGEGTGLGLSLSYDIIVKQHGGQVTVQSRPNEFTEFVITLPRKMPANQGGHA